MYTILAGGLVDSIYINVRYHHERRATGPERGDHLLHKIG